MDINVSQCALEPDAVTPTDNPLLQSLQKIVEANRTVQWDTCCRYTTTEDEDDA